jgi:hypothetical protein
MPPSSNRYQSVPGGPVGLTTLTHRLNQVDKNYLQIQDNAYYYMVRASDACPNHSAFSSASQVSCTFQGTPFLSPPEGTHVAGAVPMSVSLGGGGDTYLRARIHIAGISGGPDIYDQTATSYPFLFPLWNTAAVPPGTYAVDYEVENATGCTEFRTSTLTVDAILPCPISPAGGGLFPTLGTVGGNVKNDMTWDIINDAGVDLFIDGIDLAWTNTLGFNPLFQAFYYPSSASPATQVWAPAVISPVSGEFSPPLFLDRLSGAGGPVNVKLEFSNSLVDSQSATGETVTIRFRFHDASSTSGSCTFLVTARDFAVSAL